MRKYLLLLVIGICFLTACGKNEKNEDVAVNNTENIIIENENGTEISTETEIKGSMESVSDIETTESENVPEVMVPSYTYADLSKTMYASVEVNVRDLPSTDGNKLGALSKAQEIVVTGQCNETGWYRITYNGAVAYVSNNYLQDTKPEIQYVQDTDLQVQPMPEPEEQEQQPEIDSEIQQIEQQPVQPVQPDSNVQFPGPDSDNVLWVDGNSSYEEGLVVVKPRYMYWNNGVLYAECYIVNGCDYTVSGIEVETLSFANDSGEFAWASFGELVDVTIPPYMNIIWTFVYTEDAVIMPNADLNNVYYYSNVYYY